MFAIIESHVVVQCSDCGMKWKLIADPPENNSGLSMVGMIAGINQGIADLQEAHQCAPRPKLKVV